MSGQVALQQRSNVSSQGIKKRSTVLCKTTAHCSPAIWDSAHDGTLRMTVTPDTSPYICMHA
jgi:hypothetical protein